MWFEIGVIAKVILARNSDGGCYLSSAVRWTLRSSSWYSNVSSRFMLALVRCRRHWDCQTFAAGNGRSKRRRRSRGRVCSRGLIGEIVLPTLSSCCFCYRFALIKSFLSALSFMSVAGTIVSLFGIPMRMFPSKLNFFQPGRLCAAVSGNHGPATAATPSSLPAPSYLTNPCGFTWFPPRQVGNLHQGRRSLSAGRVYRW